MDQHKNAYTNFKDIVHIRLCSQELYNSYKFFDGNKFPRLEAYANGCAYNLHLIEYSLSIINQEIDRDKAEVIEELHKQQSSFAGFDPYNENNMKPVRLLTYTSPKFFAAFGLFIITIKSLLDVYAILLSRSISIKSELDGFSIPKNCKKITGFHKSGNKADGKVGGKFLNFLKCNSPQTYLQKEQMISCFEDHIEEWICDIVSMRDELVHNGAISGFIPMRIPLLNIPNEIQKTDILLPCILINGEELDIINYCHDVWQNIDRMLKETLELFPKINE